MNRCFIMLLLIPMHLQAQNTGIGTSTPLQKLDVNGAIKIGNTATNTPGSLRYNAGSFEGGNGTSWKNLEGLPSKAIILAQSPDTIALKAAGFSVLRTIDLWDTAFIPEPTNFDGSWSANFPLSGGGDVPGPIASIEAVWYSNSLIYYGADAYLYQYDVVAKQWKKLPNISPLGERNHCGVTLLGDNIYITGGDVFDFTASNILLHKTSARYNMLSNTWSAIADIPVNSSYHATAAIGSDIYLLDGGSSATNYVINPSKKLYRYNTLTDKWSGDLATATTPDLVFGGMMVARGNKLVFSYGNIAARQYDPVTHVLAGLTNFDPVTNNLGFNNGFALALAGDKLFMTGRSRISGDPTPPLQNPLMHFVLDLSNPAKPPQRLNVCQLSNTELYIYKYNDTDDKFYALSRGGESFIFDSGGTEACTEIKVLKGYWSYMKKN